VSRIQLFGVVATLVLAGTASAAVSWRACEGQGDTFFRERKYCEALDCFIRAIVIGPKPTPERLWRKHAATYAETPAGRDERRKQERTGGQPLPPWEQKQKWAQQVEPKATYAPTELVKTIELHTLANATDVAGRGVTEPVAVVAPEYEITNLAIRHVGTGRLVVTGTVRNTSECIIHNPRLYVAVYDHVGKLRGRNWGYLTGGRNSLERGRTKDFEVKFMGFKGTVGFFKAELVARFKRPVGSRAG